MHTKALGYRYDKGTFLSLLHFYGTRLAYGLQDAEVATEGPFRGGAEDTTLPLGQTDIDAPCRKIARRGSNRALAAKK